jgi:acyl-CoA synthetase (AMP-forming)/AMP-acid ligase II
MIVGDMLVSNSDRYPTRIAIVDGDRRLTWRDLNERTNMLANSFLRLGMVKGDRIAVLSDNCSEYVEILFACAKVGLIAVCLNYRLASLQLARMVNLTDPQAIVFSDKFETTADSFRSSVSCIKAWIEFGNLQGDRLDYESLICDSSPLEPDVFVKEDDGHVICFSSGTTGLPKAALITHRNLFANGVQISVAHSASRDNVFLLPLGLYTRGGQQYLFSYSLVGGKLVIINFSPESYLEAIEKEKVDTIMINHTLFNMIKSHIAESNRNYDVRSVKLLRSAGQGLSYEQWKEVVAFFNGAHVYKGLATTEAGVVTTGIAEEYEKWSSPGASEEEKRKYNSLGKPLVGCAIKVVDENGRELPPGQVGKFACKGDNVVKTFWKQPEVEKEVLKDGWFYTGDLASIEDGYLYLMGRQDDRIRTGGYNVYPVEIEEALAKHPSVQENAVFGVKDEHWAEVIVAAVILRKGQSISEEELKDHCRKYLARYQVPKKIHFVNDFPRHPVWKRVLKKELAQALAGA